MAEDKPLVYSCSGCSSAAQMANDIAVKMDRMGVAEMSCIAGVGGDVPYLVKIATSGRKIVAVDGCPLNCVKSCLQRHGVRPSAHFVLTQEGVSKRFHEDPDPEQTATKLQEIVSALEKEGVVSLSGASREPGVLLEAD